MSPTEQELALSRAIFHWQPLAHTGLEVQDLLKWANKLMLGNWHFLVFSPTKLRAILGKYISEVLGQLPFYHPVLLPLVFDPRFSWHKGWGTIEKVKFAVRCLMRWKTRL
jgi:hypothetical protein